MCIPEVINRYTFRVSLQTQSPEGQCVGVWWGRYKSSIKRPVLMSREVGVSEHPRSAATPQPENTTNLAAILVKINMASFTTAPPGGWGRRSPGCPQKVLDKMSQQIMKD